MTRAKTKRPKKKKTKTWTTPTVLGLILSVVGALGVIELRPQLSVTPLEQLASNQPFSAPFEITDTGYLGIHVDYVTVVWPYVEYPHGLTMTDASSNDIGWDNFDLGRGGSITITPNLANGVPIKANIVIAVDYRYFGVRDRWIFMFDGLHGERWQWSKQPAGDRKTEFNK